MNKLRDYFVRLLIDFCCGKALKYQQRTDLLHNTKGTNYIYSIGSNVVQRDKWLKRIYLLEKFIGKA
jgi:hypothetical protein